MAFGDVRDLDHAIRSLRDFGESLNSASLPSSSFSEAWGVIDGACVEGAIAHVLVWLRVPAFCTMRTKPDSPVSSIFSGDARGRWVLALPF